MKTTQRKPRQSKCRVCKSQFVKRSMSHVACSPECAISWATAQKEVKARAEYRKAVEKIKSRSDWMKEAQSAFNAWIRWRDRYLGCISCQKPATWPGQWHAGHYLSRGSHPALALHPDNCHKQCVQCNHFNPSGTARSYRLALIDRIGLDRVEALESDTAPRKYTIDQLKEIRDHYRKKLREDKKKPSELG